MLAVDGPTDRRYVVAMHGDRPVALRIDTGEWDVAPGIVDEMIAGFRFVDPEPARIDQTLAMAGGLVELGLSEAWGRSPGDDEKLVIGPQELTVVVGDDEGRIVTCVRPAGPWEQCREVRVTTLDELAEARAAGPDRRSRRRATRQRRRDEGTLGGEPSVVTRIQAYEYPAQSGQEVVYVVAMHAGRPYIVRIWTSENEAVDVESVIAGFRLRRLTGALAASRPKVSDSSRLPVPPGHETSRAAATLRRVMELPLFPLHTVLCPGVALPLHIFEERYRLMVERCVESGEPVRRRPHPRRARDGTPRRAHLASRHHGPHPRGRALPGWPPRPDDRRRPPLPHREPDRQRGALPHRGRALPARAGRRPRHGAHAGRARQHPLPALPRGAAARPGRR